MGPSNFRTVGWALPQGSDFIGKTGKHSVSRSGDFQGGSEKVAASGSSVCELKLFILGSVGLPLSTATSGNDDGAPTLGTGAAATPAYN